MGANTPEYMAQYRAENPGYVNVQAQRQAARHAAARRLREQHPEQYRALLAEELARYGIES